MISTATPAITETITIVLPELVGVYGVGGGIGGVGIEGLKA
jgi:hypothetical protein